MLREAQFCNLTAASPSELLKMEVDKLRQYLQKSYLLISRAELRPKKATESVADTEENVCRITEIT